MTALPLLPEIPVAAARYSSHPLAAAISGRRKWDRSSALAVTGTDSKTLRSGCSSDSRPGSRPTTKFAQILQHRGRSLRLAPRENHLRALRHWPSCSPEERNRDGPHANVVMHPSGATSGPWLSERRRKSIS